MLTSKERAKLRGLANRIDSIMNVGKSGITPEFTASLSEALEKRELVKLSVLNNCIEDTKEIADTISGRTHSEVVAIIGGKIILYRKSKKKPLIEL